MELLKEIESLKNKGIKYDNMMERMTDVEKLLRDSVEALEKARRIINPVGTIFNDRTRMKVTVDDEFNSVWELIKGGGRISIAKIEEMFPSMEKNKFNKIMYLVKKIKGIKSVQIGHKKEYFLEKEY